MSIDRDLINEALLSGLCVPSSQPVPPGFIGHDDDSPDAHEFDPEAAQALLDEAGVEPFTVSQLVGDSGIHAQLGEVVAEQLAEIGITAELHPLPIQSLRAEWRTGNYDMLVFPTSPTTPDMISIALNDYLGPDGVKAEVPGLQKLVDEARPLEIGTDERKAALEEISALLFDEPLHVPICQVPGIYVYRPGLLGADSVPGMLLSANIPDTRNVIWSP